MKNKILSLLLVAVLLATTSFASGGKGNAFEKIYTSFNQKFTDAQDVTWNNSIKYIKATFVLHGQVLNAYFTKTGDLIGMSRNILSTQLPINLQSKLKKLRSGGWISELVEFAGEEQTVYYAIVEEGDQKIMLKSAGTSTWTINKIEKKN